MSTRSLAGGRTAETLTGLPLADLHRSTGRRGDRAFGLALRLVAGATLLVSAGLIVSLAWGSRLAMREFGFRVLFTSVWDPVAGEFGALPFIYGTIVSSGVAMLIAVPLGLGAAIYLAELAPQ